MAKTTTIELKQFVKDALLGIIEGVDDANSKLAGVTAHAVAPAFNFH